MINLFLDDDYGKYIEVGKGIAFCFFLTNLKECCSCLMMKIFYLHSNLARQDKSSSKEYSEC